MSPTLFLHFRPYLGPILATSWFEVGCNLENESRTTVQSHLAPAPERTTTTDHGASCNAVVAMSKPGSKVKVQSPRPHSKFGVLK